MVGLGSAHDVPPNSEQPPLIDGIHLRWAFKRELGFPWHGFYLFRRAHDPGTPSWLSQHTGKLPPGPWSSNIIDTPLGRVVSDQNLMLTENFPPPGTVEFDLAERKFLAVAFPDDIPARRVETRVGFRSRPGDPPPLKSTISFLGRSPGSGPNPRNENGVIFEARNQDNSVRPNTFIRSIQTNSGTITGLGCKFKLHITLPQTANFVEITLTGAGRRNDPDGAPTIEVLSADEKRLDIVAMRDPGSRVSETFLLAATGIKHILIDEKLTEAVEQADSQDRVILNELTYGNGTVSEVLLTAYASTTPVQQKRIRGYAGRIVTEQLEFEGITGVDMTSAPAALIDLGVVPLSQGATNGWAKLSGVPYPLRLPITHPDYPCTPQAAENFAASRTLATDRIKYGSPQQFTSAPVPVTTAGTISVTNGSPIVTGTNTNWTNTLVDTVLQVGTDPTVYTIVMVVSPTKLVLSRNYSGASRSGSQYLISHDKYGQFYNYIVNLVAGGKNAGQMVDRTLPAPVVTAGTVEVAQDSATVTGTGTSWTANLVGLDFQLNGEDTVYAIAGVESATKLTLERSYSGDPATGVAYSIGARLQSSAAGSITPRMPAQSPLDMVLLGSLHPAVAQMSGLYFTDVTADPAQNYDYLIVADYNGVAQLNPNNMLDIIRQSGFSNIEGSIVYNLTESPAAALEKPAQLELYALPGSSRHTESGNAEEAVNNVGLRWDLNKTPFGVLLPGRSVMYHLWRANLGNGTTPGAAPQYNLLTKNWPILVVDSNNTQSAPDWPPFSLHAMDNALGDGWYSYQVSGIDIFGRHTPNSVAGAWRQWSPAPEPRPWYYQDPPSDAVINSSAIRLLTKIAPPPPTGIEAFALDPSDPTVLKDSAYNKWWTSLTDAQKKLIGLRVRWQWPQSHIDQAPHTREFRIYYQPGSLNAVLGNTQTVIAASATESDVTIDIPNTEQANSYVGAALYAGEDAFVITGSEAGTPLRVRVRHVGPRNDIAPQPNTPCTIATPPAYTSGLASVANGSKIVTGNGTQWTDAFTNSLFKIATDDRSYRIANILSPTQLVLAETYEGTTKGDRIYSIRHPRFVDYSTPTSWQRRYFVVPQDKNFTTGTDAAGQPVRNYEIFLPAPGDGGQSGLPLTPSLTEPIVYAHVGVSAADDKSYTADDPKWTDQWSGRPGNEGRVGAPVKVFRVLRDAPPAPQLPRLPERMFATRGDQNGASFYTYRWQPLAHTAAHVYRAYDEAVFQVDWPLRPRPALDATKLEFFPNETVDPRWDSAKRQQVSAELNKLNTFTHDETGTTQALAYYRTLTPDALRVLAGLTGNDAAFTQITTTPLYPDDPANNNRRGPDDPDSFNIGDPANPLASPTLRALVDQVDGRLSNRLFYRAVNTDAAHNPSFYSLATPPVFVPKVVPPQPPLGQLALADKGKVRLQWMRSPESDLARYFVYQAVDEASAVDVGTMNLIARVAPSPSSIPGPDEQLPIAAPGRPELLEFAVQSSPGDYLFRIVAVDQDGNHSSPSELLRGKSLTPPLAPPDWNQPVRTATSVLLSWTHSTDPQLATFVERRAPGQQWTWISGWLPQGIYSFSDVPPRIGGAWEYRLRVRNEKGQIATVMPVAFLDVSTL
jgi:hypothetical protein